MSTTQIFTNGSALYTNGKVAISKDLVFGLSVFSDRGWMPLTSLVRKELELVRGLIDNDPLFLWKDVFNEVYSLTDEQVYSISTDGTLPSMEVIQDNINRGLEAAEMTSTEYLTMRDSEYRKMLAEATRDQETGDVSFVSGNHMYALARKTPTGYIVHSPYRDGTLKPLLKVPSLEELYVYILKTFW